MIIGIASGKGGTGKTTVALNLAKVHDAPVSLLDCDVEAPNVHLFLEGELKQSSVAAIPVPQVDSSICNCCGECSQFCQFGAIAVLKTEVLVFPELCHGCGGCQRLCPKNAIKEVERRIGLVEILEAGSIELVQGRLDVGVAMSPPLIKAVKNKIQPEKLTILDAPPGTTCSVITTLRGVDFAILVSEPTSFGLNDLQLAVEMLRELKIPFGVLVNRMGIGDSRVHEFCATNAVPVLSEIPDDRRIAEAYSRGELIVEALPEYRELFIRLLNDTISASESALRELY